VDPSRISQRDQESGFRCETSRLTPLEEHLLLLPAIGPDGDPGGFHGTGQKS
jgi:hypothetical protein